MLDLLKIDDNKLSQTIRSLKGEFISRGWGAEIPNLGSSHVFVDRKDGSAPLHIFSSTPPATSFAAGLLANDKYGVYQVLKVQDIPQPETIVVNSSSPNAVADAEKLIEKVGKVVIKPVDGGHGNGVTVNINQTSEILPAMKKAAIFNKSSSRRVLVQEMIDENLLDIRILCIDYKFVAAINRVPASVTGDGKHSVEELINIENTTFRGKAYFAELATIDVEDARQYLGDSIHDIPDKGVEIRTLGVANYGRGGKLVDITDDIPEWMQREAEKAATACGLAVCGVDYLAERVSKDQKRGDIPAFIVELNKTPILAIHDAPTVGKNRGAVKNYVDYLARIGANDV
ncbi:hypothetical protein FACS189431_3110 [Alphaproteobacteria bacterium]|nr:hypothetical protein FACS189431_3110 [Alphaproteobacteria bacterium]